MRTNMWNRPLRWILTGLLVISLITDGSLMLPALNGGTSQAFAQDRMGGPGEGFGRGPGGGPGSPPQMQHRGGGPQGPGFEPQFGPGGGWGYGPGPGHYAEPGGPGFQPRPPYMRPPQGPGPWQTGRWVGVGPAPWWFGRPFLWDLTAVATATVIAGITYYLIDGIYYRPYMQRGITVYVQVPAPYPY